MYLETRCSYYCVALVFLWIWISMVIFLLSPSSDVSLNEFLKATSVPSSLRHILFSCPQFSCSVVSDSLRPHGLQRTKLPCPSPTPGACSKSCPLNQWCHSTISSSVIPFSSPQSFPASGSFPMSWFFTSGGLSVRASASASVLPMNTQDWFSLGWTG